MTIANVSTYANLQGVLQNVSQVENTLNNEQIQISSGYVSQTFAGLGGNVDQFVALNAQVSRLQNYQQNNTSLLSELNTTNTTLTQIQQIATSLQSLISSQISGTASAAAFNQQLLSNQTALAGELNTTFAGNYLFGGTNTNTPPVKVPLPAPLQVGTPDSAYYQGSAEDVTARIADDQVITNSVRADNTAFQQIFAGIAQALQAGGSTAQLQNAETLVSRGLQGVIAASATVNANIVNVQDVNTENQSFQTYYQGLTDSISKADVVSLSSQVAQNQSVLEASFETFSRISSLNLSNYLK